MSLLFFPVAGWAQASGDSLVIDPLVIDGTFGDSIDVRLFTLQVHVFDRREAVVQGLDAADFEVRIDGRRVPVDAAEWVQPSSSLGETAPSPPTPSPAAPALPGPEREEPPRLMVVFVQNDFHPSRLRGHIKTFPTVEERLLRRLPAGDYLALVSFDHHLKLRADFTRDRDHIVGLFPQAIRRGKPDKLEAQGRPSLARHWDWEAAEQADSAEHGLELLAKTLQRIDGDKSILFLGYGLGSRYHPTGTPHFASAREELLKAQAPLLALNVTAAASNDLGAGLAQMAWKTGGTYHKTDEWPALAVARIERLFHGHYLLFVPWQHLTPGEHALDVRLAEGLQGRVRVAATAIEATGVEDGEPATRPGTRNRGPG